MRAAPVESLETSLFDAAVVFNQLCHEQKVDQVVGSLVLAVVEAFCACVQLLGDLVPQRQAGNELGPREAELGDAQRPYSVEFLRVALRR
jgi:hypothetical protein